MIVELTEANFEQEVVKSEVPVVVDFWAPWCGPCKMMSPIVDELSEEMSGIKFCKVNTDEADGLALKFKVMSIPTIMLFKNGEKVKQSVGAVSKQDLMNFINE